MIDWLGNFIAGFLMLDLITFTTFSISSIRKF